MVAALAIARPVVATVVCVGVWTITRVILAGVVLAVAVAPQRPSVVVARHASRRRRARDHSQ